MVLGSLIDSGIVPVVRLTGVFRQAGHRWIITIAHRINEGHMPAILPSHRPHVRARMPQSSATRSSVNCWLAGQTNLPFDPSISVCLPFSQAVQADRGRT